MASGLAAGSCALLRGCWVFGASREVTCSGRREGAKGVKCAKGSRYVPTPDLRIAASAGFGFPLSAWEKRDCCRALAAGARTGRCAPRVGPRGAVSGARGDFGAPCGQVQIAECKVQNTQSRQLSALSRQPECSGIRDQPAAGGFRFRRSPLFGLRLRTVRFPARRDMEAST